MLYIASDHAGFKRKEIVKRLLEKKKVAVVDVGPHKLDPNDDYPDYAAKLARRVVATKARGVLLCGNAEGVCIVANKFDGIRAAVGYSVYAARTARKDDNANVLCLPGRALSDTTAKRILDAWLAARPSKATRHKRRLKKIREIEKTN